ncbi:Uncharacterised protein [Paucimonas lemoignei]|nr:Uncharacterised protein [Paucimonas lemoignei]
MAAYLIDESDIAGLESFRTHLENYPTLINGFLKNLGLMSLQDSGDQAMINVASRARRDITLWPDTAKKLRQFHQDATSFISDANELVTQLKLYKRPDDTDSIRENLNTLSLHAEPFNMKGKLGISASSNTYDVTYVLSEKLNNFDNLLYNAVQDMQLIQQSVADIIPRTIDFMKVKISEHESRHRKPDSTLPEPVRKQLEAANNSLESSKTEYSTAIEAANNLHAYCNQVRELLSDARSNLLRISDKSNVRSFLLQINLMGSRVTEAQGLINRARDLI